MHSCARYMIIGLLFFGSTLCYQDFPMLMAYKDEIEQIQSWSLWNLKSDRRTDSVVIYYLYTRNSDRFEILKKSKEVLDSSHFDAKKPTKFLIHGFFDNYKRPMPQNIKNNLLSTEDVNVIIVDWGKIAIGIDYSKIARRTPEVGASLAGLMNFLVQYGCDPKSFHLIGHSLGAHVAGFAGKSMTTGKPARITGLDPALPMFKNAPPSKRLDSGDADFVDVIHTCGGLLGLKTPIGHADFYPNKGTNVQPGCSYLDFGRCSHIRSHLYFAESIFPSNKFYASKCDSGDVRPESCLASSEQMGYFANPSSRGLYYVPTNKKAPFAIIHP